MSRDWWLEKKVYGSPVDIYWKHLVYTYRGRVLTQKDNLGTWILKFPNYGICTIGKEHYIQRLCVKKRDQTDNRKLKYHKKVR